LILKKNLIILKIKTKEQIDKKKNENSYSIRCFVNNDANYSFQDELKGFQNLEGNMIGDFIIRRNNGTYLLNFVVVIDDYLMKISHILRGEDHLTNTAKQIFLYNSFN
jgi:nondiscriminating glutamyl-tRNA synthetase